MEELVSIIMPTYNCSKYIRDTIQSVLNQTYSNWELIIVDDCSTDDTSIIVKDYQKNDSRILYHKMQKNSGAAVARNKAIDLAKGSYIAFLDSDDLWFPDKLDKQIYFMKSNGYSFTCTSYTKINERGEPLNKIIKAPIRSNFQGILKQNPGNLTVIYSAKELGKTLIPDIRKRNDYVMWLQVVKKAGYIYGLETPLASHRIRPGALSINKYKLVKYHWIVYRRVESLSLIRSIYLIVYWILKSVKK
ncbi:glycosyltransferase family 2 protein [Paenibacillus protaetiae]|uniref:Glycosyltransferase family 2 protein n=1 Tax=Paenibacillus protaetiae TaxID=2509456 RepID=A0A4P6F5T0_9BACL|nr:glycosyltransferase family 2 protein [Paenibacillus protaetiae]